jgi:hypothetical protein
VTNVRQSDLKDSEIGQVTYDLNLDRSFDAFVKLADFRFAEIPLLSKSCFNQSSWIDVTLKPEDTVKKHLVIQSRPAKALNNVNVSLV